MHTIMLDGREYILRCDLNVIEKMNEKYSDSDYVCTPEDELVIENARQRIAEKYGDTYEN